MPGQIIPILDLASVGVVQDAPSVSLPPQVFTDVRNVRFEDGAIRKLPGEAPLFSTTLTGIRHIAFWPAPTGDKYVVIIADRVHVLDDTGTSLVSAVVDTGGTWQHTLFNGGFHIIINNGNSTPMFIQDDSIPLIADLPGWDSYAVDRSLMNFEHDGSAIAIPVTNDLIVTGATVKITSIPRSTSEPIRTDTGVLEAAGVDPDGTFAGIGTIENVDTANNTFNFIPNTATGGTTYIVSIVSDPVVAVTAGVIRAYGSLLVAGNLVEDGERTLTGTIRTSDVAQPGAIPENWNPFSLGVNTADEFTLASTGTVQDMVELQGVLYVYTDESIHAVQQTGNPQLPFQISPVTDSYGADNMGSVLEVDGKHIVVGSNDVYIFAGHPGSIKSIADGKVRRQTFFNSGDVRVSRFNKHDELWFWTVAETVMYIWNYRDNTWTIREQTAPTYVTANTAGLVVATVDDTIITVDDGFTTEDSYVERRRMAMAPEFDTENLASVALLISGNGTLNLNTVATNIPGDTTVSLLDATNDRLFSIATEYKQDIREQGRFLNYRATHIVDPDDADEGFVLSGMQLDIGKGGTR